MGVPGARRAGRAGGFVLVAVLAMLVVLSLLAATIGTITRRLLEAEVERQRLAQAEIDIASTRATVLYLLASQRMTMGGLTVDDQMVLTLDEQEEARGSALPQISLTPVGNEIRLDGTAYRGLADIRFSLQDDRGAIAVNWTTPELLQRLLEQLGPTVTPVPVLRNLLLDYQDADDLYRINSAEADGYRQAGLLPPSNRTLATPLELRRVMGWRDALAPLDDAALVDTFTVVRSPMLNVNTASERVLASLPGVDAAMAARAVAARAVQPFTNLPMFHQLLGVVVPAEEMLSLYPSGSGTLKLWSAGGGAVHVLHWTLTPLDDGGRPWREDYELTLSQDGAPVDTVARQVAAPVLADPPPASE